MKERKVAVSVTLSPETLETCKEIAAEADISVSKVIDLALKAYFKNGKKTKVIDYKIT